MNTIQRTAKIDSSRRILRLDEPLPDTGSAGQVDVTLVFSQNEPTKARKSPPDRNAPTPLTDWLSGILAGAGDISKEQIREERLQKWLQ